MANAATNEELAASFTMHLEETEGHSQRLEEIFNIIDAPVEKHAGETIRGLLADGRKIASAEAPASLKDALLAGAGRGVEHYEMASYMNAIEEAKGLELSGVVSLLEETLAEEKATDKKLEAALKVNLKLAER